MKKFIAQLERQRQKLADLLERKTTLGVVDTDNHTGEWLRDERTGKLIWRVNPKTEN